MSAPRFVAVALAALAFVHAGVVRAGVVTIAEGASVSPGRALDLAYDETGALRVEEVRAGALPFARSAKDVPSFGYRKGSEWARFELLDTRPEPRDELVLEYGYAASDLVEVHAFGVDGGGGGGGGGGAWHTAQRAGDHVPHAAWPVRARLPTFRLPRGTREVLVRVAGDASHQIPLALYGSEAWHEHRSRETAVLAGYYGALFAMLVYNLLVWVAVGLGLYGYYVGFLSAYGVFSGVLSGSLYASLLGESSWLNDHLVVPGGVTLALCAVRFMLGLLDLGARRQAFVRGGRALDAFGVSVMLASIVIPYSAGLRGMLVFGTLWVLYLLAAGLTAIRAGERSGRWYLVAWSAFLAGSLANMLRTIGLIPTNFVTANAQQAGSLVEFLLLSFALADRIKQLQADATANAELAARNEQLAREASERALAEQERANHELRRLDALKDEFLANTSHELRTPLNGIIGMTEAVHASSALAPSLRAKTKEVLSASHRLSEIIGTIMDFSAAREGGGEATLDSTAIVGPLTDAVDEIRAEATSKGLVLRSEIGERAATVRGAERELLQIFRALLSNALKFSDFGSIEVRTRRVGERVEILMSDEGCGIPEARLGSLFTAFVQGDGSATRRHGGTGLGLALAKKLVERLRGTIAIQSTVGVGTKVLLSFEAGEESPASELFRAPSVLVPLAPGVEPRAEATTPEVDATLAPSPSSGDLARFPIAPAPMPIARDLDSSLPPPPSRLGDARRARILVVDDDRLNRLVIGEHLRGAPFDCVDAASGAEALRIFGTQGPFDAVLLDVMMPGMSGYEVCRRLRQIVSANDVPILMLTAKQQVEDLVEGFDAGANDYVHKPIAKGELLARVAAHVSLARTSLAMRRFVPRETIRLLGHDDLTEVALGDATEQQLTVAFSDVRGFTQAVERMSPRQAFEWLNRCYGVVGPEVRKHKGFIDKYIGDAVMALFPRRPSDAVRAAIAMHRLLVDLPEVRMGTGIHLGSTMLGTLGEPERFEATVLSDAVNVASRVEGASKHFGARVLVTREVRDEVEMAGDRFDWRTLGAVRLKGRANPVELFELLDADPEAERARKLDYAFEFDEAIGAFASGALRQALLRFEHVLASNAEDGVARAYAAQIGRLLESGDDTFDGTYVLTDK